MNGRKIVAAITLVLFLAGLGISCSGPSSAPSLHMPVAMKSGAVLGKSAPEVESALRRDYPDEFPGLNKVEARETTQGLLGEFSRFDLKGENDHLIGSVSVCLPSGELNSVMYAPQSDDQVMANRIETTQDAQQVARDFIARWGFELSNEYVLTEENQEGDQYRLQWQRQYGEAFLCESFYVELNAQGRIGMAMFPRSDAPLPQSRDELEPNISRGQALELAKEQFPPTAAGSESSTGMELAEEQATLLYQPMGPTTEPRLLWSIEILYQFHPGGNGFNGLDHRGATIMIDAKSGAVLSIDYCM